MYSSTELVQLLGETVTDRGAVLGCPDQESGDATQLSSWLTLLGPQHANRYHRDAVWALIGVAGSRDHPEMSRLTGFGEVDTITESEQASRRVIHSCATTQLDFERCPRTIHRLNNGINLESRVVAVVEDLRVVCLCIDPEIPDHKRFEE